MNVDRLNKTVEILRQIEKDDKPFDMSDWIHFDSNKPEFCGTACCALGYVALNPAMQAKGLLIVVCDLDDYDNETDFVVRDVQEFNTVCKKIQQPDGEGVFYGDVIFKEKSRSYYGFYAAAEFYGITFSEACKIFDPETYGIGDVKPHDVIDRIQYLLSSESMLNA